MIDAQRHIYDGQQKFNAALIKNPDEAAKLVRSAETAQVVAQDMEKRLRSSASGAQTIAANAKKAISAEAKSLEGTAIEVAKL